MARMVGRPQKLTVKQKEEVWEAFASYIKRTADPNIAGFVSSNKVALEYWVTRYNIQDWSEFSALRERMTAKSEQYLLKKGGTGAYHPTMAKFRLKQKTYGYTERVDSDITSGGEKLETSLSGSQIGQLVRARAERSNI